MAAMILSRPAAAVRALLHVDVAYPLEQPCPAGASRPGPGMGRLDLTLGGGSSSACCSDRSGDAARALQVDRWAKYPAAKRRPSGQRLVDAAEARDSARRARSRRPACAGPARIRPRGLRGPLVRGDRRDPPPDAIPTLSAAALPFLALALFEFLTRATASPASLAGASAGARGRVPTGPARRRRAPPSR